MCLLLCCLVAVVQQAPFVPRALSPGSSSESLRPSPSPSSAGKNLNRMSYESLYLVQLWLAVRVHVRIWSNGVVLKCCDVWCIARLCMCDYLLVLVWLRYVLYRVRTKHPLSVSRVRRMDRHNWYVLQPSHTATLLILLNLLTILMTTLILHLGFFGRIIALYKRNFLRVQYLTQVCPLSDVHSIGSL